MRWISLRFVTNDVQPRCLRGGSGVEVATEGEIKGEREVMSLGLTRDIARDVGLLVVLLVVWYCILFYIFHRFHRQGMKNNRQELTRASEKEVVYIALPSYSLINHGFHAFEEDV